MKNRDLANLLNRAAAVIEDPSSETGAEKLMLIKDLLYEAHLLNKEETPTPAAPPITCKECGEVFPLHKPDCRRTMPASGIKTRGMTADIPPPRRR